MMDLGSYGATADNNSRQVRRPGYENAGNENAFLSIDDALNFAGDNSRYQKRVNNIFSFQYGIYSFLLMGFPLLLVKPIFFCKGPDGTYHPCGEKEACASGDYQVQNNNENNLTTDFELYCEKSYLTGLLGTLLFAGSFLAFLFFPYFGNRQGRKAGIVIANVISGISALVIGFAQDIEVVMVFLVLCGFAYSGFEILCFSYTAEVSGERFRNISTVTLGTVWAVAQIITAPLFLFSGDWRKIFIFFMAVPWLLSLWPTIRFVYETPRFLNSKGRFEHARAVINKICIINKRPAFRARLYDEMEIENSKAVTFFPRKQSTNKNKKNEQNSGYMDLFKHSHLRKTTLVLLYIWFFRNYTYFGLNYSLPVLGSEVYQNFTIAAISETLANLFAVKIKFKVGRIKSLYMSIILASSSCLLIYFFPIPKECFLEQERCYQKTFSLIFAVIAKFSIALFANILVTYTSENYPTEVRSLGLGLTITASRIGAVAMPSLITLMSDSGISPLVSFGAMGILAFIMIVWCLPETYGMLMTNFILELRNRDEALLKNHDDENS